jgi:hypothetical protein
MPAIFALYFARNGPFVDHLKNQKEISKGHNFPVLNIGSYSPENRKQTNR